MENEQLMIMLAKQTAAAIDPGLDGESILAQSEDIWANLTGTPARSVTGKTPRSERQELKKERTMLGEPLILPTSPIKVDNGTRTPLRTEREAKAKERLEQKSAERGKENYNPLRRL
jgi:hypothetical protein